MTQEDRSHVRVNWQLGARRQHPGVEQEGRARAHLPLPSQIELGLLGPLQAHQAQDTGGGLQAWTQWALGRPSHPTRAPDRPAVHPTGVDAPGGKVRFPVQPPASGSLSTD